MAGETRSPHEQYANWKAPDTKPSENELKKSRIKSDAELIRQGADIVTEDGKDRIVASESTIQNAKFEMSQNQREKMQNQKLEAFDAALGKYEAAVNTAEDALIRLAGRLELGRAVTEDEKLQVGHTLNFDLKDDRSVEDAQEEAKNALMAGDSTAGVRYSANESKFKVLWGRVEKLQQEYVRLSEKERRKR